MRKISRLELSSFAPAATLDLESAPEYMGGTAAPIMRNVLSHKPGRVLQRGSLQASDQFIASGTTTNVVGPAVFGNVGPYAARLVFFSKNGGGGYDGQYADIHNDGSVTYGGGFAYVGSAPSGAFVRTGDTTWWGTADYIKRVNADLSNAAYNTGPYQPIDLTAHVNRLFVLGGAEDNTVSPIYRNRLYWSDSGYPQTNTHDQWRDDVSGLVNKIELPDDGVALHSLGSSLLVFCESSIMALSGSGPSTFSLNRVLHRGATNRDAICGYGDAVYFLSRDGLFYFDGAQERLLSDAVASKLAAGPGTRTGLVRDAGNGYLYVAVTNNGVPGFTGLYHMKTGAWTEFTMDPALGAPLVFGTWNSHVVMFSNKRIYRFSDVTDVSQNLGYDWDGTTRWGIDTAYTTRTLRLYNPVSRSHIRRVLIDYRYDYLVGASTTPAWTYGIATAPPDGPGGASVTYLAQGTVTALKNTFGRSRFSVDVNKPAEDLWVELTYNSTTNAAQVEALDIWVIYDGAQESPGF